MSNKDRDQIQNLNLKKYLENVSNNSHIVPNIE